MWLLVPREPRANAPHWTGRRWLAAIDAAAWPLFWVLLLGQIDAPVGIGPCFGSTVTVREFSVSSGAATS